jgi:hypothetical protein
MEELNKGEKKERRVRVGVTILIILCVAVALWTVWQYPKYLHTPFAKYGQDSGAWKSQDQLDAEKIATMKKADTDGDGLSDYDETYVYGTSPYLADSDSDGFTDKQEIDSGNDPNCPAGKTCVSTGDAAAKTAPTAEAPANTNTNTNDAALNGFLSGAATADDVRNALRQAGVDDATLNKLDDKTLLELYNQTLTESGAIGQAGTNTNTNANTNSNADTNTGNTNTNANTNANTNFSLPANVNASNITPAQLRDLLRQAGVDDATLSSVDDATLMKIFQDTVNK